MKVLYTPIYVLYIYFSVCVCVYIYIFFGVYNKSAMPENTEKYFMTHRGNRTHDLDNTA